MALPCPLGITHFDPQENIILLLFQKINRLLPRLEVPGQKWRWYYGQPSGDGDCVVMYKNYAAGDNPKMKGYFNDLPCNSGGAKIANRRFICEETVGKGSHFH